MLHSGQGGGRARVTQVCGSFSQARTGVVWVWVWHLDGRGGVGTPGPEGHPARGWGSGQEQEARVTGRVLAVARTWTAQGSWRDHGQGSPVVGML